MNILTRALNRVYRLHASASLNDLKIPPSNHLEKLQGNRKEQYSIRINQQKDEKDIIYIILKLKFSIIIIKQA